MRLSHFFLLLFLGTLFTYAQNVKNTDHQNIIWTRYYNQLFFNEKWSLHTELDNRVFVKPFQENVFVARIQGRYKINEHLETGVGFAYFSVDTQIPEVNPAFNTPEYRGQQDLSWKETAGKITINQRFQAEERFTQKANKEMLLPGTLFSWRFRYRLQADFIFWKKNKQLLKAVLSDEVMFNIGKNNPKNTFDQNRIYAAIQYGLNPNIALELGYLNSYQRRASGVVFFNSEIIRLSVFHRLHWKNKS